jgi:hypothetical protein
VPGEILTVLCGHCRSVIRIDLSVLTRVPMWLEILIDAFRDSGVQAIRVQTCDICMEMPAARDITVVLSELKRRIEGP